MHLVYFFTHDYSLKTWDEAAIYSREVKVFKELSSNKIDLTVVTYGGEEDLKYISKLENIKIIPIYTLLKKSRFKTINYINSILLIPFLIRKKIKDAELLMQNQLMGSWLSICLKILLRKPILIRTGYDMYTFSKYDHKSWFKRQLYYYLTYFSLAVCDIYTVTSKVDLDFLCTEFPKYKRKILLRQNWIEEIPFNDFKNRYNDRLLMVGRLENQKNYFYAIDLLENSGLTLDVYGAGSLEKEILKYAQQKKVKVQINGVVSNEELREIYSKYKIYLSTSKFEGNSKTILEAMNAGCVVFASKIDNNLELFNTNNGILFKLESQNEKEVLNKMLSYLNNSSSQPLISSNAVEYTKKNHLLKKYVDSLINDLSFMI